MPSSVEKKSYLHKHPSSGEKKSYLHKHKDGERGILYNRNGGHMSGWLPGSEVDLHIFCQYTYDSVGHTIITPWSVTILVIGQSKHSTS